MQIGTAAKNYNVAKKPVEIEGATVSSKNGVLTIQAGDMPAKIDVQEDSDGLKVKVNDKSYSFKKGEYPKGIEVKGGKGDDDINVVFYHRHKEVKRWSFAGDKPTAADIATIIATVKSHLDGK